MTRGLPPGAAGRLRAGAFVPPAVASVFPLPVWLVFVGTVLLSVVLGGAGCGCGGRGTVPGPPPPDRATPQTPAGVAAQTPPRRATVSYRADKAPGATHRGRAVPWTNAPRRL